MFGMTSLDAHIDESVNIRRGPYVFKILGQLCHWIRSLCPSEGELPRFLQLYIYDTDNEVDNRMNHFGGENNTLRRDIIEGLIELLDAHNALVQFFRTAHEKFVDAQTGRLFQQYVVATFCAIEHNIIDFKREHQSDIRNEYLSGVYDAIIRGDSDGSDIGARLTFVEN
ncbi:hypothetical protein Tco_0037710 [Tanacetum coccineum]